MKKIIITIFLLFFPMIAFADIGNIDNAGFVPGPIWFSKYPVFSGDEVRIYTALYNNSKYNIKAKLYFYNNGKEIGSTDFEMLSESGAKNIWVDWVAEKGEVEISAEIKNILISDGELQVDDLGFLEDKIASSKMYIDSDNDSDGLGNKEDEDDDNDGVNDIDEIAEGTDPFRVDHLISTSSAKEETKVIEEEGLFDKIDNSVMGFLNKITKNKVDLIIDNFTEDQAKSLQAKKDKIKESINGKVNDGIIKLDILKTTTTSKENLIASGSLGLNKPSKDEETVVKNNINNFFKNIFSKIYLVILTVSIFLLSHPFFLFLLIFFIIFLTIKKIVRFFVG